MVIKICVQLYKDIIRLQGSALVLVQKRNHGVYQLSAGKCNEPVVEVEGAVFDVDVLVVAVVVVAVVMVLVVVVVVVLEVGVVMVVVVMVVLLLVAVPSVVTVVAVVPARTIIHAQCYQNTSQNSEA